MSLKEKEQSRPGCSSIILKGILLGLKPEAINVTGGRSFIMSADSLGSIELEKVDKEILKKMTDSLAQGIVTFSKRLLKGQSGEANRSTLAFGNAVDLYYRVENRLENEKPLPSLIKVMSGLTPEEAIAVGDSIVSITKNMSRHTYSDKKQQYYQAIAFRFEAVFAEKGWRKKE
jgi:hypothetical protein